MKIHQVKHLDNFSYVIVCPLTGESAIIDPSDNVSELLKLAGGKLSTILVTHAHFDHIEGIEKIKKYVPVKLVVWAHQAEIQALSKHTQNIHVLRGGESVMVGNIEVKVIHTPGHSEGSVCYMAGNALFTGDTLFIDYVGRADLKGGNPRDLFVSLHDKISKLPDSTIIYPGHDYGRAPFATLKEEKTKNPFLIENDLNIFLELLEHQE